MIQVLRRSLAALTLATVAQGQPENPVYIDDSPAAWELFQLARDQVEDNPAEAVRLFQELLDDHPLKLIPVGDASNDHYTAVRRRVADELIAQPELLERYQLIQSAQARRMLDGGELSTLAVTRGLTVPGLEATLRLAQADLESARFESALGWLDEARRHPSLTGDQAAHGWFMTAVAAHYLGNEPLLLDAESELDGAFADQLRGLVGGGPGPAVRRGLSSLDHMPVADLSDLVAEEIWSIPLSDSLLSRRFSTPMDRGNAGRRQKRDDGDLMTTAATASGATVFINQGFTVLALDRFTGRQVWTHVSHPRMGLERDGEQTLDMNFITVDGDSVVTIIGHAAADGRATDGRVICLSAATGEERWSEDLHNIGTEEDQELFPHGQPIVAEGVVYVLGRKVTRQALTSAYVVALNVETGGVLWSRHLASSGGLRRSSRSLSTLTYADGDLYVASAVGAVAKVNANSGETQWLRRFPVPISPPFQDQNRRPWEVPAPVVVDDMVIAVQPNQRRIVSIDRDTGHVLGSYAAEPHDTWYSPRYLLANDHSVYAIGREIRAFRLTMLDTPIWQLPLPDQDDAVRGLDQPLDIRGRVQLAGAHLIVPTLDGVFVVDGETGMIEQLLPIRSVGTPLALDAQLLMAGSDRLDAFMSFSRAEEMLRQRVASAPDDPGPALSLLRLGARARELDLALEAAAMALRAIDEQSGVAAERSRQELFDQLLQIDTDEVAANGREGEALHAMIGSVARKAPQRVEHLLAYGKWLTRHSMAQAVEQYQAILSLPELASVTRIEDARERPAAAWTTDRLARLIDLHGPAVYGPQSDYASLQLQNLLSTGAAERRLVALAEEFPFADAATEAALRASLMRLQKRDPHGAAAALLAPYRLTQDPRLLARVAGAFVRQCETLDRPWPETARETLRHVIRVAGPVDLRTADGERSAKAWLRSLDDSPRRPLLGTVAGMSRDLPGRLVPVHGHAGPTDTSSALLYDGRELRLVESGDLEERWRHPLDDPAPLVLLRDEQRALVWLSADREDPRAVMIDAIDGSELWTTPALRRHLGDGINELFVEAGARKQMPNSRPFEPKETLPLVAGERLFMVRRTGGTVAFDLDDGTDPTWAVERALDEVHVAAASELGVVLAGASRRAEGEGQLSPRIVILAPDDGSVRHRITPPGSGTGVRWLRIGPLATLIFGTAEGVFAMDMLTGELRWGNLSFEAVDTLNAWVGGDHVIVEDNASDIRALALADGTITDAFAKPAHGDWNPLDIQGVRIVDDRIYARYRQRVVRFDELGVVLGADIITDRRDYRWMLPTADGLLVVSRFKTEQAVIPNRMGRRMQHTYRIYHLSENCKVRQEHELSDAITSQLTEAAVIDGWLLLSSSASNTLAIPMSTP